MPIPPYHAALREHIGTALIWAPGVSVHILRERGDRLEVLLQRRSDDGSWNPICGSVDPGEDPDVCAVREAREETGIDITIDALLAVRALPRHTIAGNGHQVQYLDLAFVGRPVGDGDDAHVADEESLEIGWYPTDELPPMPDRHVRTLRLAVDQRRGTHPGGVEFGMGDPRQL
ncbi:NUDIX domain-containing protein [Aestuariimicrobium soli]|uniref:NUDIX domain-containing protein n=1 Tax=Aestuariimicrobium soli TaxID=2035834 RepID=UPI003EBA2630